MTLLVVGTVGVGARAQVSNQQTDRIRASADVLADVRGEPDKDIPRDLWNKAQCVVVVPGLKKAAFGLGGEYGKGMMSCRTNGAFGAPVFMELEKGSWGFQIGGESIDLVLLVMNPSGMKKMLGDKVSLGADISLAAGPVGRNAAASTDAQLHAEGSGFYSRARRGLFAGIDVSGGVEEDLTSTPITTWYRARRRGPCSAQRWPQGSGLDPRFHGRAGARAPSRPIRAPRHTVARSSGASPAAPRGSSCRRDLQSRTVLKSLDAVAATR